MKLNQKGFSAIEVIAVLVIVTLIGFVGWRVYDANQDTSEENEATTQNEVTTEDKTTENSEESVADKSTFCGNFKADLPEGWTVFYRDADKANIDCLIQSYSDDNPNIPSSGPYYDGLSVTITSSNATQTINEIQETNNEVLNVEVSDDGVFGTKIVETKIIKLGDTDAVYSSVIGGISNQPDDRYTFIINGTQYVITGLTTNETLKTEFAAFAQSFEVTSQ